MRWIFFPSTPPAALAFSTTRVVPLCDAVPKLAVRPVRQAYSPTGMVLPLAPPPPLSQPARSKAAPNDSAPARLTNERDPAKEERSVIIDALRIRAGARRIKRFR